MEVLFKDMQGAGGGGLSPEQFEQMRQQNDEIKALLQGRTSGLGGGPGTAGGPGSKGDAWGSTMGRTTVGPQGGL